MTWKFTDEKPVYQQIIEKIQDAVLIGEFPAGSKFPSVREIAANARVNPNTMQHALQELERQQLLVTMGTNGRYVTENEAVIKEAKEQRIKSLTEECVKKFEALGVSSHQAAGFLMQYGNRKE